MDGERIGALKARAQQQVAAWDVPGLALGVLQGGQTLLCTGIGQRDENGQPWDGDTLFEIGSCSKAFTSAAAMILCERGLLDLDAPVVTYLPEFQLMDDYATAQVTARDLLSYRSGLPRHEYAWYRTDFTRQQLVHNLRFLQPNLELRGGFQYNNLGYVLVGYLIERLTGVSWEDFVRKELLQPLHMDRTSMWIDEALEKGNCAQPFDRPELYGESGHTRIPFYRTPVEDWKAGVGAPYGPAGSIFSSAGDMLKWAAFQLGDGATPDGTRILSPESMAQMHKPHTIIYGATQANGRSLASYCLGWQTFMYAGHKVLTHNGGIDGFTTSLYLVPDLQLAAITNVNMTTCMLCEAAANDVVNTFSGVDADVYDAFRKLNHNMFEELKAYAASVRGTPVPGTSPSRALSGFAGTYRAPGYTDLVVREQNGALEMQFIGYTVPLKHFHYDVFELDGYVGELPPGLTVQFHSGADGAVKRLSIPLVADPGVDPICFGKVEN